MNEFKPLGPKDLNDLVDFRTRIGMYLNKVSSRFSGKSRFKDFFSIEIDLDNMNGFSDHKAMLYILRS